VKILIVHQHFKNPAAGGAIRSYYLAKALIDRGHKVTVLTGGERSLAGQVFVDGIHVHYLSVGYDNRLSFYKRISSFVLFCLKAIIASHRYRDYDYCYAISVPLTVGLVAAWIKLRYRMPYIFEVGDLWPEAPVQMGFIKNRILKYFLYSFERYVYANAHSIVALSPAIKNYIQQKVASKTIWMIPNMADTIFYDPANAASVVWTEKIKGKFVVSYLGALGVANGLDYLLECVRASNKASLDVHFLVAGDGAMLEHLKRVKEHLHLDNLTILGHQNREGVRDVLSVTDAAFICYKPVPVLETGSPNKLFDGLAAGKVIIINFKGWIKDLVEQQGCGVYCDPHNSLDFVDKIARLMANPNDVLQKKLQARKLAEAHFSREKLSEAFTKIFHTTHTSAR